MMLNIAHVTHEAVVKMGGIGTVLEGLLTAKDYTEAVDRTILICPLFTTEGNVDSRLGPHGDVLYSSIDGRASELCVRVASDDAHSPMANVSRTYLAYCDCKRRNRGPRASRLPAHGTCRGQASRRPCRARDSTSPAGRGRLRDRDNTIPRRRRPET